jgi:hypothetical protein
MAVCLAISIYLWYHWIDVKPRHPVGNFTEPIRLHGSDIYVSVQEHEFYTGSFVLALILAAIYALIYLIREAKYPKDETSTVGGGEPPKRT